MKNGFKVFVLVLMVLACISCTKSENVSGETKTTVSNSFGSEPEVEAVVVETPEPEVEAVVVEAVSEIVGAISNAFENIIDTAVFEKVELLDDFGDPTGVSYIQAKKDFNGTYKNSNGVSNGNLKWNIQLVEGGVVFVLKENGKVNQLSTAYYTSDTFDVKVKDNETGNTVTYSGTLAMGDEGTYNCIMVQTSYGWFTSNDLSSFLRNGKDCKIVISNSRGSYSLGDLNASEIETLWYDFDSFKEIKSLYENGDYETALVNIDILKSADEKTYKHFKTELDEICLGCKYGLGIIEVGMRGPAGGLVFYDCDADNETGNNDGLISSECGWRFLESAPSDLEKLEFGPDPNITMDLEYAIGSGKSNTEALVAAFGEGNYAAKACYDYETTVDGVVYDDWFLPSYNELNTLIKLCSSTNEYFPIKQYTLYWSSTAGRDYYDNIANALESGWSSGSYGYGATYRVCPVRAFVQ